MYIHDMLSIRTELKERLILRPTYKCIYTFLLRKEMILKSFWSEYILLLNST